MSSRWALEKGRRVNGGLADRQDRELQPRGRGPASEELECCPVRCRPYVWEIAVGDAEPESVSLAEPPGDRVELKLHTLRLASSAGHPWIGRRCAARDSLGDEARLTGGSDFGEDG